MKRIFRMTFFALFLTLFFGLTAFAAQIYTEGCFEYRVEEGAVIICGYFGKETEVTVPASIAGNPVSVIAKGAFSNSETVKKVWLPDTIMTIEKPKLFIATIRKSRNRMTGKIHFLNRRMSVTTGKPLKPE